MPMVIRAGTPLPESGTFLNGKVRFLSYSGLQGSGHKLSGGEFWTYDSLPALLASMGTMI